MICLFYYLDTIFGRYPYNDYRYNHCGGELRRLKAFGFSSRVPAPKLIVHLTGLTGEVNASKYFVSSSIPILLLPKTTVDY